MSFRSWLLIVTIGLTLGAALGQAKAQTQSEGSSAEQVKPPTLPFVVPVDVIENDAAADARQRGEQEARQREIEDLVAQKGMDAAAREMNEATQWIELYTLGSTVLVAVGTIILGFTLRFTWRTNSTLAEELIASHPPKFQITQIDVDVEGWRLGGRPGRARCYVFNSGGSDARFSSDRHYGNVIYHVGEHPPAGKPFDVCGKEFRRANPLPIAHGIFKAGQSMSWNISNVQMVADWDIQRVFQNETNQKLYVIGRIHFADTRGVERHIVFCRRYDPECKRFVPTDDPDYEYQT